MNNLKYITNELNQYTSVSSTPSDSFVPLFDDDGNQTLVKTEKGIFEIIYNAENRPIKFTNLSDSSFIMVRYDYMGRRGGKLYFNSQGTWTSTAKFFYKDYTLIEESTASNDILKEFVWDPTAGEVTRPLYMKIPQGDINLFYLHDANKNVTEVTYFDIVNGIGAHYEYDTFGNTITSSSNTRVTAVDIRTYNPFRFSSEYHDDEFGLIYYNYRHYNPEIGRWISRDPIEEQGGNNLYGICNNNVVWACDILGLDEIENGEILQAEESLTISMTMTVVTPVCDGNDNGASDGFNSILSSMSNMLEQVIRKTWNSPNTLIGFTVATTSSIITSASTSISNKKLTWVGEVKFHKNTIAVKALPGGSSFTAISLGNISVHSINNQYFENSVLDHENGHTYQSEILGPLYLPAHALSMACSVGIGLFMDQKMTTHRYNVLDNDSKDPKNEPTKENPFPKIPWIFGEK